MDLLSLLEAVLILGCIIGAVYAIAQWAPIPAPFKTVAYCIIALIVIIWFFDIIRGSGGLNLGRIR